MIRQLILATALIAPIAAFAQAPTKVANGVIVNSAGMTLYTFDKDAGAAARARATDPARPTGRRWRPVRIPRPLLTTAS